jgi:hypothetical protein
MNPEIPDSSPRENPFKLVEDLKRKAPHLWKNLPEAARGRYDRKAENRAISKEKAGLPRDETLIG